jgi:nitrous oxidase accessory protein NosD
MKKVLFTIFLILLAAISFSTTLTVGTGEGEYPTIKEAVDAAVDGDTVFIKEGTYNEKLDLRKSIEIVGENVENTIINNTEEKPTFNVYKAKDFVIKNLTLKAEKISLQITKGVGVVENVKIMIKKYGALISSGEIDFNNCYFYTLENSDDYESAVKKTTGLMVYGQCELNISNSTFKQCNYGLYFSFSGFANIKDSSFISDNNAIWVAREGQFIILGNNFIHNFDEAIGLTGEGKLTISENTFSENVKRDVILSIPDCGACGCSSSKFTGVASGANNVSDKVVLSDSICPVDYWPEDFMNIDSAE